MWDYGENDPHATSESWFGLDTKHGGADKTGHIYAAYLFGRGSAELYMNWGFERSEAAARGLLTSLALTTVMEIGDSFSDYGLSPQDLVANAVGMGLGYILSAYPKAGKFIDLRVEYLPSALDGDPTTDYEHMKHLAAFKLSGFDALGSSWLRFFEIHLGYYTRNFSGPSEGDEERNLYAGVGLNLSELLATTRYGGVFRYLQLPYTYLAADDCR
ncbi:MAG: DUF2279 domain-containing protein [Deltaproteobacteria bacterium]|nr:MAG: DUF2279 domain-containing protein [Deltaproteobacteria bacterium]